MFERIQHYRKNQVLKEEQEKILIEALYEAAREGEERPDPNEHRFQKVSGDPDKFIWEIYDLSEYYQDKNAVLSAALWGIWNACSHLRDNSPPPSSKKEQNAKQLLQNYRALVATAIARFSNEAPNTTDTDDAVSDLPTQENKSLIPSTLSENLNLTNSTSLRDRVEISM